MINSYRFNESYSRFKGEIINVRHTMNVLSFKSNLSRIKILFHIKLLRSLIIKKLHWARNFPEEYFLDRIKDVKNLAALVKASHWSKDEFKNCWPF